MFQLKALSKPSIERALKKAERYRLLNEAWQAESICRDVLEVDPNNQEALIALILAITDQFRVEGGARLEEIREWLSRLRAPYENAYYSGIIYERQATAVLARHTTGHGPVVYDWLRKAMECYQQAEAIRPAGNDDALLRWNTCARLIMRHPQIRPESAPEHTMLE
jgi:tetratricopeptide (TPR) repeat protein